MSIQARSRTAWLPLTWRWAFWLNLPIAEAFGLFAYVSVYFQRDLGMSAMAAGLAFLPAVLPIMPAGPLSGRLMDRVPVRTLVSGGLALTGVGLMVSWSFGADPGWSGPAPGLLLAGLGAGTALPPLASPGMEAPPGSLGAAAGIYNAVQQLGGAAGVTHYGLIFTGLGLQTALPAAAAVTFAGAGVTAAVARGSVR